MRLLNQLSNLLRKSLTFLSSAIIIDIKNWQTLIETLTGIVDTNIPLFYKIEGKFTEVFNARSPVDFTAIICICRTFIFVDFKR